MNRELCLSLSFTAGNKMGSFYKSGNISNIIKYSIYSNFKNLSTIRKKYGFLWEKKNFESITNLPLYLQMLINQIQTQTDNDKYRKKKSCN